jgi:hypothetical protein
MSINSLSRRKFLKLAGIAAGASALAGTRIAEMFSAPPLVLAATQATYYVSPTGSDSNPGALSDHHQSPGRCPHRQNQHDRRYCGVSARRQAARCRGLEWQAFALLPLSFPQLPDADHRPTLPVHSHDARQE